jgi:macrodomain Ter protein organizer (MatP/YcbG family)
MAKDPFYLQIWCDTWLNDANWLRLKRSLWAQKKRTRDRKKAALKNEFQINRRAWTVLRKTAKENKISVSKLILQKFLQDDID